MTDDGLDFAGIFGERGIGIATRIEHTKERGELRSGGVAVGADVLGRDVVLDGVGAEPADGGQQRPDRIRCQGQR
jgi:hypothetical protein